MEITQTSFGPKRYLAAKKSISIKDITDKDMYDLAYARLFSYLGQHGAAVDGPAAVMYFTWDEAKGTTDIAICVPVSGIEAIDDPDLELVNIPATPAVMGVLHGSCDGLKAAHDEIHAYIKANNLPSEGPAIEEYVTDPMAVKDPSQLITNLYYLAK